MSTKRINYICLFISLVPFLFSLIVHKRLVSKPSTHFFTDNSINPFDIDKQTFIVLLFFCGILFYFVSITVSRSTQLISTKKNNRRIRYFANTTLSFLNLLLLIKNLR